MANIKSAAKRVKLTEIRTLRNRARKTAIRTAIRRVETALASDDGAAVEGAYRAACGVLDRAATRGTIHRNKAARKKSQLWARIDRHQRAHTG